MSGRWCESGSVCEQFSQSLTFYKGDNSSTMETLSLCCRKPKSTCYFTAYKDDYDSIGCRCTKTWVPWTEPGAYVVPDAGYYNSTGRPPHSLSMSFCERQIERLSLCLQEGENVSEEEYACTAGKAAVYGVLLEVFFSDMFQKVFI